MKTELIYKTNMGKLECESVILEYKLIGQDSVKLILDKTPFYPKGGGQPSDIGYIQSDTVLIKIINVYIEEAQVVHEGMVEMGDVEVGAKVISKVSQSIRELHSRIHSAGHVIDVAINELSYKLEPNKGYHFPEGPYVEYVEVKKIDDVEKFKLELEQKANEIVGASKVVSVQYDNNKLFNGESLRLICIDKTTAPCGGTHVSNTSEIGQMTIRKIKRDKDRIKVSYSVI